MHRDTVQLKLTIKREVNLLGHRRRRGISYDPLQPDPVIPETVIVGDEELTWDEFHQRCGDV